MSGEGMPSVMTRWVENGFPKRACDNKRDLEHFSIAFNREVLRSGRSPAVVSDRPAPLYFPQVFYTTCLRGMGSREPAPTARRGGAKGATAGGINAQCSTT